MNDTFIAVSVVIAPLPHGTAIVLYLNRAVMDLLLEEMGLDCLRGDFKVWDFSPLEPKGLLFATAAANEDFAVYLEQKRPSFEDFSVWSRNWCSVCMWKSMCIHEDFSVVPSVGVCELRSFLKQISTCTWYYFLLL